MCRVDMSIYTHELCEGGRCMGSDAKNFRLHDYPFNSHDVPFLRLMHVLIFHTPDCIKCKDTHASP